MNSNLLFLLIIIFILITFVIIFFILFNYKKLEKFTDTIQIPSINFPPLVNNGEITILSTVYPSITNETEETYNSRTNRDTNIREKYDISDMTNFTNSLKGFGTYYIRSSFYPVGTVNENNSISGLLKGNNTNIILLSPNLYKDVNVRNWISIIYPEKFQFITIKITAKAAFSNNTLPGTKIPIANISFDKISIGTINKISGQSFKFKPIELNSIDNTQMQNNLVTFIYSIAKPVTIDNLNIFFDTSIRAVELKKIEIFGYPLNSDIYEDVKVSDEVQVDNDASIGIFTSNENSQFDSIDTGSFRSSDTQEDPEFQYEEGKPLADKFKDILTNNSLPWAAYNGLSYSPSDKKLKDIYNRSCRDATVTGNLQIKNTIINNNTITHLEGDTGTSIIFPIGSLPENYTICIISKYTHPTLYRSRILTNNTVTYPNWLLGHWGGHADGIAHHDGGWVYYNTNHQPGKTDWMVNCIKSKAKNIKYSLIINDVPSAFRIAGPNIYARRPHQNSEGISIYTRLAINGEGYRNELSNFGFAYLLIWNYSLSDNELLIISQTLTNYITKGEQIQMLNSSSTTAAYGTQSNPGLSAEDIKNRTCTTTDGFYWIRNPATGIARKIYCIMDPDFDGGGWMLAMKAHSTSTIFHYDSDYWTKDNLLNELDEDLDFKTDAKYDIFNYYKVKKCMAIFDFGKNVNDSKHKHGWRWMETIPHNLSLKDFFRLDKSVFIYYSSGAYNLTIQENYDKKSQWNINKNLFANKWSDTIIIRASSKQEFQAYVFDRFYSKNHWSRQEEFQAYGFNITTQMWDHRVRWGCVFNENPGGIPDSCDVSGGIGLSNYKWSAGNGPRCCESHPGAQLRQMGFKWFIK